MNNKVINAVMASYGRSVLAGALTLLLSGYNSWTDFALALVAAVVPVLIRAINPNDPAFGKVDTAAVNQAIEKAVADALAAEAKKKAKKTVAKAAAKPAAKKTTKPSTK